jgi:hypothetical protein
MCLHRLEHHRHMEFPQIHIQRFRADFDVFAVDAARECLVFPFLLDRRDLNVAHIFRWTYQRRCRDQASQLIDCEQRLVPQCIAVGFP